MPVADFTWSPSKPTVLDPNIEFEDLSEDAVNWSWNFDRGSNPGTSSYRIHL